MNLLGLHHLRRISLPSLFKGWHTDWHLGTAHLGSKARALSWRLLGFVPLIFFTALVSQFFPEMQHTPQRAPGPSSGPEVEDGSGSLSDRTSGSEADERRLVRPRAAGWSAIFQRLDNKTLEEIPPVDSAHC
ncbi:hypothetical protein B0T26DRAFT_700619 [Lasiosphaeria miniovina]|uniref:Uncharacterized protein n=1 Tax=Lasiosphaeria miniovina TaxID=1954250 RepID=A0AA40DZX2_9PEZI|nr:uncharacterized protein B0T26DRAFT_700619 [Lasiosphaeria miniovina]KAK0721895.1 hypothetical protein B0T26DRAFT_700619 [Lasiosphaeria miniovina]